MPSLSMVSDGKVFSLMVSALRGRCLRPLNECATTSSRLAGDIGFEPILTDSESAVLPLDESPPTKKF